MSITKKDLKMMQLQDREAFDNLMRGYLADKNHRVPQTRRDFLTSGVALFAGTSLAATLSQLISVSAYGADCGGSSAVTIPAYINIQLSGGAALFANYLVRGSGGTGLTYSTLGMGTAPTAAGMFANNAPFWRELDASIPASGMVRGLLTSLPEGDPTYGGIYGKTAFVSVAAESLDDRNTNKNDLSGMLAAAGVAGSSLPHLYTGYGSALGEDTSIPTNLFVGAVLNSASMLKVSTAAGLQGGLSFKGALAPPNIDPVKVVKAIENLSKYQVEALANNPDSHESKKAFADLVNCSTAKNTKVMAEAGNADFYGTGEFPNKAALAAIWAKNKTAAHTDSSLMSKGLSVDRLNEVITRSGLVVANCMRGFSAAATINLGGFDYHFSQYNRAEATLKDHFFGDILGRILKTAQVFNRKVFIHVSSDGSVGSAASASGSVNWNGENQKHGMNYIFAYNPVSAPPTAGFSLGSYNDTAYQLNHFTPEGNVNNQNPIGSADAQDLCASAIFLNYLNFAGMTNSIEKPALAAVKKRLTDSLPSGVSSIHDYYTRIKAGA